jgi:hypothetical protein
MEKAKDLLVRSPPIFIGRVCDLGDLVAVFGVEPGDMLWHLAVEITFKACTTHGGHDLSLPGDMVVSD